MRCKSLPEEWTAGGRLSDVSVQERTNRLRKKWRKKVGVCVCVRVCDSMCASVKERGRKGRAVEKGLEH